MKKFNPFKPIKIKPIKLHYNFDSDRDGVLDHRDCQPFNYWKQHKDPGDWLETEDPKPIIYGEETDWLTTKRYKRRPKIEKDPYYEEFLDVDATAHRRYSNWNESIEDIYESVLAYIASIKGLKPGHWNQTISSKDMRVVNKDVLEVYDRSVKVYHYFDVSDVDDYPKLLLSVTKEDKDRLGMKRLMRIIKEA